MLVNSVLLVVANSSVLFSFLCISYEQYLTYVCKYLLCTQTIYLRILVEMPGMRGISMSQGFGLPNEGLMFFALALFVTTALLKNAGNGYAKMIHFMTKCVSALKDEEKVDLELGLAKEIGWDAYSHDRIDPLQKHYTEEKSSVKLDPRTNLFIEEVMPKPDGEYPQCSLLFTLS